MKMLAAFAATAVLFTISPASADPADFYKGKNITYYVGNSAGGGYDTYTRLLARYFGNHVPGNPGAVVQNMPGGGGLVAANHVYNVAPKDGTVIGSIIAGAILEHVFSNPLAKLDGRKFTWIGVMDRSTDACLAWTGRNVQTADDFLTKKISIGAAGASSRSNQFPKVMQDVLGAKFNIILGYKGTPDRIVAMERGELDGACGISLSTVKATLGGLLTEGKLKVVLVNSVKKSPDFPDVPLTVDFAKTDEARQILQFMFGPTELGRPYAAAPEVPADRTKSLREAFDKTMKDAGFLADASKSKLDIQPMSSAETLALVEDIYATPKSIIERAAPSFGK